MTTAKNGSVGALAVRALDEIRRIAATCEWVQDDEGNWGTSCGNLHAFIEDGPSENNHKFCPYCGGRLEVVS